jgi:hypothetical protein
VPFFTVATRALQSTERDLDMMYLGIEAHDTPARNERGRTGGPAAIGAGREGNDIERGVGHAMHRQPHPDETGAPAAASSLPLA